MSGQIHNPDVSDGAPLPDANMLPKALLYSIAADIGGIGLPKTAHEGLIASEEHGFLKRAIAYGSQQGDIPPRRALWSRVATSHRCPWRAID